MIVEMQFGIREDTEVLNTAGACNDNNNNSIEFNSLLFMCRVNRHRANYRQHSTDIHNYIMDTHNNNNNNNNSIQFNNNNNKSSVLVSRAFLDMTEYSLPEVY
jgi:hypothetical protein